jgi:hypothetical protein
MESELSTTTAGAFTGVVMTELLPVRLICEKEWKVHNNALKNSVENFLIRQFLDGFYYCKEID